MEISGACTSCDRDCACPLPDIVDIAESIEDVLGGARPISARCLGAVAAIGGRELVGDPPGGREVKTESETLREAAFVDLEECSYLWLRK